MPLDLVQSGMVEVCKTSMCKAVNGQLLFPLPVPHIQDPVVCEQEI